MYLSLFNPIQGSFFVEINPINNNIESTQLPIATYVWIILINEYKKERFKSQYLWEFTIKLVTTQ